MRLAFSLLNERQLHQSSLMVEVLTQEGIVLLLQFVYLIYLLLEVTVLVAFEVCTISIDEAFPIQSSVVGNANIFLFYLDGLRHS